MSTTALQNVWQMLNARIDCAEADIAEGRIISREEASERMQSYMNKYL